MSNTNLYLAAALILFVSHAVPSWPGVRPALVARLGRPGFMILHSALSLAALGLFVHAYRAADVAGLAFVPADGAAMAAVLAMPLALLMIVARVTTRAPESDIRETGIFRVTRYPGSVGLLLWALLHLQATGDLRRVILFATMAAIALFAIAKNDWVLRRSAERAGYRARSSILPFAAIAAGRQRFVWREIGAARVLGALVLYAAILFLHPLLFGVDPLYWLP